MLLAYSEMPETVADDSVPAGTVVRLRQAPLAPPMTKTTRYEGGGNRSALIVIALAHAILLFALIKLDVVHLHKKLPQPILIELKPIDAAPPPRQLEKQEPVTRRIETPIVAPPPVVAIPLVAPPQVIAAPVAPPAPPKAAPAADPAPPAPIVPPDADAATLGNVPPRYPVESRRQHEEGTVRLRVVVSTGGNVDQIDVAKSSGFSRLDKAALEAVRRWRFRPGTQAGKPVQAVGYLSIPFALAK